jgi:esterase/lipase superfamily enzyme
MLFGEADCGSGRRLEKNFKVLTIALVAFALASCAGRPEGNLIVVSATAPGASTVDMLVATTRASVDTPAGVMFNGERAHGTAFADITVSIPPDQVRKIGDVQWPDSVPGDPARDFVTLRAEKLDLKEMVSAFNADLEKQPSRNVLVFVHGYNTSFEESVYRFAQIVHDSGAPVVPVLFTWPSRGQLFGYVYDRESATYSRDHLEGVLQAIVDNPKVKSVSVLAHSMGNFVAVEALRQMAIRHNGLPLKIKNIMLASPDIDFEVFRREIAEIEKSGNAPPVTLFVSNDDKALSASSFLAGGEPRLGDVDPRAEPFKSNLEKAHVNVIDLSNMQAGSSDSMNHSKFSGGDVVTQIGDRLASGQTLTDTH